MAGKRQHFVPQFIQKGFASRIVGEEAYAWVYRKESQPFETNIKNIGVEGFFYSDGDDHKVDEVITDWEHDYVALLTMLRSGQPVANVNVDLLAKFLAHLEVRTRHLRHSFLAAGNHLFDETLKSFENTQQLERALRRKIKDDPDFVRDIISDTLKEKGLSRDFLPILFQNAELLFEKVMPDILSQVPEMASSLRKIMPAKIEEAVKTGHLKALNQTIVPDIKIERFSKLEYKIIETEGSLLPLGDSIVLFHVEHERSYKTFLEKDDELKAVLLPLTPQRILVASNSEYHPDLKELPLEIARCSLEYFISSELNDENTYLSEKIGENAHLLSNDEIEELVSNSFL